MWLLIAINVSGQSLTVWISGGLDPVGMAIGLDGVILLAYIIAIPANEIVVPTILMAYTGHSMIIENLSTIGLSLEQVLVEQNSWTLLTAINQMLFSLLRNPCSTTMFTIYKETKSAKWTAVSGLIPLSIGFIILFILNQGVQLFKLL
ncbi:MAG: nucleoside recognition domain-containing protein [Candidatus Poribacteria bacterium]|jgi:ferrous iron transport protein B|nr:nucleoside recognition domain-containing protein [Candidatus Poribacteria bacterium]